VIPIDCFLRNALIRDFFSLALFGGGVHLLHYRRGELLWHLPYIIEDFADGPAYFRQYRRGPTTIRAITKISINSAVPMSKKFISHRNKDTLSR
jgi:hypothetical protein